MSDCGEKLVVEAHDVTVSYGGRAALYGVDVRLCAGRLVGVLGPNGAGKSTFLRAVLGLVPLSGGWVRIFGEAPERVRRRVGYVPQRGAVDWDFPVCVRDVVMMGRYGRLWAGGWPGARDREVVRDCVGRLGLEGLERRQIGELSGGQQQRVFLARALAQEADVYFLDEPFAGVDATTEAAILGVLRGLRDEGRLVVVVHHDLGSVREYFDDVVLLNQRLVGCGAVGEVFTEEGLRRAYGGRLALLSDVVVGGAEV